MSTPSGARVPSYRRHKQSGQAIVTLNFPGGARKDVPLGEYGSPASHHKYQQVVAEWLQRGRVPEPPGSGEQDVLVEELILRFWNGHVITYYRHLDGTPTTEQENFRQALRARCDPCTATSRPMILILPSWMLGCSRSPARRARSPTRKPGSLGSSAAGAAPMRTSTFRGSSRSFDGAYASSSCGLT